MVFRVSTMPSAFRARYSSLKPGTSSGSPPVSSRNSTPARAMGWASSAHCWPVRRAPAARACRGERRT